MERAGDANFVGEPAHERFAQRELLQRHPFVGLMRLSDVTGTADDRWHAGVVEQRRFAAERNLADLARSAASLAELGDVAAAVAVKSGCGRESIEHDV